MFNLVEGRGNGGEGGLRGLGGSVLSYLAWLALSFAALGDASKAALRNVE